MNKLKDKVALVVAATRGIGLASAKKLASEGAKVYLGVRRLDAGQEVANEIQKEYNTYAKACYFDASKVETYESLYKEVLADSGGLLHVLLNNYGGSNVQIDRDLVNTDLETWHNSLLANLDSVFMSCKLAIPNMIKSGGGSIINMSSIGSVLPDIQIISYTTAKAGINSLTRNIATQYAHKGIRCNAVLPGITSTEAIKNNLPVEMQTRMLRHIPLKRMAEPEDIANAVLFFACDDSRHITGQLLEVAGGSGVPLPSYADYIDTIKD